MTMRWTDEELRRMEKLQDKIGFDRSGLIRYAVLKLLEAEGIK